MADNRKRITGNIRFDFTGSAGKLPLIIVQLAAVLLLAVMQIVFLVQDGFSWYAIGLLALWVFIGYIIVRNAYRAYNTKAAEKAREKAPEFTLTTPVPESEQGISNSKADEQE